MGQRKGRREECGIEEWNGGGGRRTEEVLGARGSARGREVGVEMKTRGKTRRVKEGWRERTGKRFVSAEMDEGWQRCMRP